MKGFIKWFLDGWNEIDPFQEAVLADLNEWMKSKQKKIKK